MDTMQIDLQMVFARPSRHALPEDGVSPQAVQCASVIRIERVED